MHTTRGYLTFMTGKTFAGHDVVWLFSLPRRQPDG